MKSFMLLISFAFLISFQSYSQLKLEGTIKSRYKTVQLENGELKYYFFNAKTEELTIYNLDDSVWKTIKLPLEKDHFFEEILFLSQKTINPDQRIEIIFSCSEYFYNTIEEDPDLSFDRIKYSLNIIDETGKKLLTVPNSHNLKITSANGQKKLLVYQTVGKSFRGDDNILVYALPGKN